MADDPFAPPPGAADPFRTRTTRQAYANPWLSVEHREVIRPDGADGLYGIVRMTHHATGVLPFLPDGSVVLVGQWRVPLDRWSWEMPEGGARPGEDPQDCARRELEEETGYRAARWLPALSMDLSNSLTDERATTFVAWDLTPGKAAPEGTEVLAVRTVGFGQLLDGIGRGAVRDALTVATALKAHQMALAGVLPAGLARAMLRA